MAESGDRSSLVSKLDPRPIGWPKVAVLAVLVAGTLVADGMGAEHTSGVLLGLSALALGINGVRGKR